MWKALILSLCLAGCTLETTSRPPPAARTEALYGPQTTTQLTPYPSNRYTRADATSRTGRRVSISPETMGDAMVAEYPSLTDQLDEQDGFSVLGGVTVHFSAPIDPALTTLSIEDLAAPTSPLRLIDVDPASPERGRSRGLVVRAYPDTTDDGSGDDLLVAQPSTPLRPRTTYLFVVTDSVKDASGNAIGPSAEMTAVLDGTRTGDYEASVRAAIQPLVAEGALDPARVALATVFTTGSVHEETLAMAAALRASPTPALDGDVVLDEVAETEGDRRVAFRGRFAAPEWRSAADGKWKLDAAGVPIVQSESSLEFLMVFSDRDVSGPRPVVVFAHGLTSSKEETWKVASWLADQGVVAIGIDAPMHGSRPEGVAKSDIPLAFFSVDLATKSFDLKRGRDNFRQMASDQLQLVRALRGPLGELDLLPVGAPDGVPDLAPDQLTYLGTSFGSVLGSAALALAPELKGAVLNVGGGGLMTIVQHSPLFKLLLPGLFQPGITEGDMARLFSAAQSLCDAGDPLNFARFVTLEAPPGATAWAPRSVLVQEVLDDALVPNVSTELLSRTLGLTQIISPTMKPIDGLPTARAPFSGNLSNGATAGIFQFGEADGKPADHSSLLETVDAREQIGPFLGALARDETCVVLDPFASPP